jgi:UDP-N-acetylmuramoyl-tripeptide--D-alanyl-D-alanine ligase
MLELGRDGEQMHESLMDTWDSLDGVITIGAGFLSASKKLGDIHLGHYDFVSEIDLEKLTAQLGEGDTILVKGSNKVFWVNGFVESLLQALTRQITEPSK